MTDYVSSGVADNWAHPLVWTPNGIPGINDTATIQAAHTMTLQYSASIFQLIVNGRLNVASNAGVPADLQLANAAGAKVEIGSAGIIDRVDSLTHRFYSAGGSNPTDRWYCSIANTAGSLPRALDLEGIVMSGNYWYLGDEFSAGHYVPFNIGDPSYPVMTEFAPLARDPSINEHAIDGRSASRIYVKGGMAGRTTVKGYVPIASLWPSRIEALKTTGRRLALTGSRVHLPSVRIESLRWGEVKGPYIPFSMTLVEEA